MKRRGWPLPFLPSRQGRMKGLQLFFNAPGALSLGVQPAAFFKPEAPLPYQSSRAERGSMGGRGPLLQPGVGALKPPPPPPQRFPMLEASAMGQGGSDPTAVFVVAPLRTLGSKGSSEPWDQMPVSIYLTGGGGQSTPVPTATLDRKAPPERQCFRRQTRPSR